MNGLKTRALVPRRVRVALVNSRKFKRAQALRHRNLRSQISDPVEVETFNPKAFRDLICARNALKSNDNTKTGSSRDESGLTASVSLKMSLVAGVH
jgi:hypothetical protein